MAKTYEQLLSDETAWPELARAIGESRGRAVVVPPRDEAARRACLEGLQVTTRSTLGAIAHETGGLLVDHGWLRLYGCGSSRVPRALSQGNEGLDVDGALVVAEDVMGGLFAVNGGGLGETVGSVFYFAPDTLEWEDTELGHSDWVGWVLQGDLAGFYDSVRWDGWEKEVAELPGDQMIGAWPPPWTDEGHDPEEVARKVVPSSELCALHRQVAAELAAQ